jgi:hypothetical protein
VKWREDLPYNMRAQMCVNNGQHFYIFEPLQTFDNQILIPIFLYTFKSQLFAKCIRPQLQIINKTRIQIFIPSNITYNSPDLFIIPVKEFQNEYSKIKHNGSQPFSTMCQQRFYETNATNQPCTEIQLPNPWRTKADGKIIRHIPTTMYSDNTSGNISKQFNKHISFYFTFSGLPPTLTNQEYNCHFLSTSNRATVLEIAGQIVEESK